MKKYTKLILAPHADDDVLGCGGILDSDCFVVYCGLDESGIQGRPSQEERVREIEDVVAVTRHGFEILENPVNQYAKCNLISDFERVINDHEPLEVYVCHPSYNQDHKEVYDAAMVALRPHDKNGGVDFKPNYFVPIDVEKKVKVYTLMESQVRSFRGPDHVRAISKLRGGQSNCEYAEAFQVLRWVK